jgi:hypothetical protein
MQMLSRQPSLPLGSSIAKFALEIFPVDNGRPTSSSTIVVPRRLPEPQKSSLGGLPLEIWDSILEHLFPKELVVLAQLNSHFHKLVTGSIPWRFFRALFPTSRKIWNLSWEDARDGYFARTIPPSGHERVKTHGLALPQDQLFHNLFLGANRKIIEFLGPSVRHRHNTFLTQTDFAARTSRSWRICTSHDSYLIGPVISVGKVVLNLPPRGHHLRPAGLDIVGTVLFWVDYEDRPLDFGIDDDGIYFDDEIGENVLWPEHAFPEDAEGPSLLHTLFLSWNESRFEFSGSMVSALSSVGLGRKQVLRLYDYEKRSVNSIPFDNILRHEGPWLGEWVSPWILPWGFDDDDNLLFKILDTRMENGIERIRCVQTSYNLENMRTTFSVEILEDIQLLNPWNFQLFSDQCWGYPAKDSEGNIWCILRDLRDGNIVRRVGPLNPPNTKPKEYSCHISMFHVMFQDKSSRRSSTIKPANSPLRIFPINPLFPFIKREFNIAQVEMPFSQAPCLYELSPPFHPNPPEFWTFGGEDASERYLFFQGGAKDTSDFITSQEWRKWVVWDSVQREWSILQCERDWEAGGFFALYSETDGLGQRVGLDWVYMGGMLNAY